MKTLALSCALLAPLALVSLGCNRNTHLRTLDVSGTVEVYPVELSFRTPGRVLVRSVDEGMAVTAGQVVSRLDAADLQQMASLRQSEALAAQAALAAGLAGSRPEEVDAARASLDAAEADLRRAEPDFKRIERLFGEGVLSRRELEASKAQVEASRSRVAESRKRWELVTQGLRKEDLSQLQARAKASSMAAQLAETQLGFATLQSPLTGVVLSRNVEPGEYVAPGTPVLTVANLETVHVRAYVDETDLGRVKLGQKVQVRTDAWPDRTYEGKVAFISDQAEFTPKTVQTQKERTRLVYRIKVEVSNPAMELKPGMPADARIVLEP